MAISGADPVAYFKEGKAIIGDSDNSYKWNGANRRSKSAENRDAFAKNSSAFTPQFGGYCAYAVSRGYTAIIDLEAWVHCRRQGLPELFRERPEFVVQRRAGQYRERRS